MSVNGGGEPSWRRDGEELYFVRDRQLFAVDIKITPAGIEHSVPRLLFTAPFPVDIKRNRCAPAADGQRFLVMAMAEQPEGRAISWSTGERPSGTGRGFSGRQNLLTAAPANCIVYLYSKQYGATA